MAQGTREDPIVTDIRVAKQDDRGNLVHYITYSATPNDNAYAHNSIYRGKDITDDFENGIVSQNIANGSFKDIFVGDYIRKTITDLDGTEREEKFIIGECDYWLNQGDTACTTHHCVIIPESTLGTSYMNTSTVTSSGFSGSAMWTTIIPKCSTLISTAFGESHILEFRDLLSNSANGTATANAWYKATCNLMSEIMVYGSNISNTNIFDTGVKCHQLAVFRFNKPLIHCYGTSDYWLSNIISATNFSLVNSKGNVDSSEASTTKGVRPFSLLI